MEYEIVHFLKENERAIRREKNEKKRWLSNDHGERIRTLKQEWAKRFFHKDEAESALVVIKRK